MTRWQWYEEALVVTFWGKAEGRERLAGQMQSRLLFGFSLGWARLAPHKFDGWVPDLWFTNTSQLTSAIYGLRFKHVHKVHMIVR